MNQAPPVGKAANSENKKTHPNWIGSVQKRWSITSAAPRSPGSFARRRIRLRDR